jgi:hypothetical protein
VFNLAIKHIKYYGSWCNQCNIHIKEEICRKYCEYIFNNQFIKIRPSWLKYKKYNLELDGYCSELNIAFEHNGLQHNEKHTWFHNNIQSLEYQKEKDKFKINKCKELGIKLIVIPELFNILKVSDLYQFIIDESKKLGLQVNVNNKQLTLSNLSLNNNNQLQYYKYLAIEKKGQCISNVYLGFHEKLTWKCKNNHIWDAVGFSIENGSWCPYCAKVKKLTLSDACYVASEKGGKCLSQFYVNASSIMDWECSNGHRWKTTLASTRNLGTWCPYCRVPRKKITKRAI